jgi:hypothetical protein
MADEITVSAPNERVDLVALKRPRLGGKEPSDDDYRLRFGGSPRLLMSLASPTRWGGPSFAFFFAKGGSRKCRRQVGLITCPQQNQIAQAASPPTPSTTSGAGSCKKRKDGAPAVGTVYARVVKGGPVASIADAGSPLETSTLLGRDHLYFWRSLFRHPAVTGTSD